MNALTHFASSAFHVDVAALSKTAHHGYAIRAGRHGAVTVEREAVWRVTDMTDLLLVLASAGLVVSIGVFVLAA